MIFMFCNYRCQEFDYFFKKCSFYLLLLIDFIIYRYLFCCYYLLFIYYLVLLFASLGDLLSHAVFFSLTFVSLPIFGIFRRFL